MRSRFRAAGARPPCASSAYFPKSLSPAATARLACQPQLVALRHVLARDGSERRLVAREGLEPSKPLGRQIYSLLRLTASLPRQLSVLLENDCFWLYLRPRSPVDGAGEGIRTPDLLITNQLLYQTELRQPRQ